MYSDIKTYIYKNISDIDTLVNACSTDTRIRDECAKFSFWKPIFEQYSLPLPNEPYNTAKDWIDEYIITRESKDLTDKIINYVNNNKEGLILIYPIDPIKFDDVDTSLNVGSRKRWEGHSQRWIVYYFTISKYTINSFIIKVFLAGVEESYIISHDQFSKFIFDILL